MGDVLRTLALRTPFHKHLNGSRLNVMPAALRAFASSPAAPDDRSRGGLPRFYSNILPSSKGASVRVQGDEFWHITKVLRLRVNDRLELFNGRGSVIEGYIESIDRTGLDFLALDDPKEIQPKSIEWHVFAAFGGLKGGRGDWLVEKCTELGASSITPMLTERSPSITENRGDRLQRVVLAASKQCQRLHEIKLNPPMKFQDFLPIKFWNQAHLQGVISGMKCLYELSNSKLAFLAAAGANPLVKILHSRRLETRGLIIIGPEGDFTEEEIKLMAEKGAILTGLGPCRLRVETAAVALLSALMLWSDSQDHPFHQLQHGNLPQQT